MFYYSISILESFVDGLSEERGVALRLGLKSRATCDNLSGTIGEDKNCEFELSNNILLLLDHDGVGLNDTSAVALDNTEGSGLGVEGTKGEREARGGFVDLLDELLRSLHLEGLLLCGVALVNSGLLIRNDGLAVTGGEHEVDDVGLASLEGDAVSLAIRLFSLANDLLAIATEADNIVRQNTNNRLDIEVVRNVCDSFSDIFVLQGWRIIAISKTIESNVKCSIGCRQ